MLRLFSLFKLPQITNQSVDPAYYSNELVAEGKQSSNRKKLLMKENVKQFTDDNSTNQETHHAANINGDVFEENLGCFHQFSTEKELIRSPQRQSLFDLGYGKLDSYVRLDKLGEGAYAAVYRGTSRLTGKLVALKVIKLKSREGVPSTAIREISLLKQLRHTNIVTLHDVIHTQITLTLVFEYVGENLLQFLVRKRTQLSKFSKIRNRNIKILLFQLLRGLSYCHRRHILHRDLKPENLLINIKGELKIADFGLARATSVPIKTFSCHVVTLWYRPPDILLGSTNYSTQIDMWAVGCIHFEMLYGKVLFRGANVIDQLSKIFKFFDKGNNKFKNKLRNSTDPLSLCLLFLKYEAQERISAEDAMLHSYFDDLGPNIHKLSDVDSIFCVPEIKLG